jgi:small-conductance mechanosensitive channel
VISANGVPLFSLFDEDAALEGLNRGVLAEAYTSRIAAAITDFRLDRSSPVLLRRAGFAALVTIVSAVLWWLLLKLFQRLNRWAQTRVQRSIDELASKSHNIISGRQVWGLFASLLKVLRVIAFAVLLYFFLNTVLGLFPWTRPLAIILFNLVLDPLESMGKGFVAQIPNLSFLVVLVFVVRYILRVIRVFFNGVARGRIKLQNFDEDWAMPTFKIVRVLVIAFALVIAYPYIPGSNSLAFKGVSVFMGVILSMGASSFISSMIAGMLMTYRGAFKEKDVIKMGDTIGTVMDIKLMTTRLRTAKNEMVVIPNSNILNADVVNYSTMAREKSLILHTIVGIGYDTPWRQVEAMLKEAAIRTPDILDDPEPFVLQKQLGDYAVNYELNAFTAKDTGIPATYSALHANIQDVFNEHGVQIMSPAYVADPAVEKVVPPDHWYLPPATAPGKRD